MKSVLSIVLLFALSACSPIPPDYAQTRCEIETGANIYALIGMTATTDIGKPRAREYSIQFEPAGLTVRFPPQYYAPDWDDYDVVMVYPRADAPAGILTLHAKKALLTADKKIGTVQRACWDRVKSYIHDKVESVGVKVSLRETAG